ncbi:transcription factor BIM2 isoform X2 [Arachis duranensis]|uniref:Transcription factor BIM2 isoform X2 n=1 Tax=Arachis duranensis TaxID=130453 RepID=A0A9C6TQE5_ARADU|nr:transcription factor BIM2 isoform X2 [Arachis duranensis]
MEGPMQESSATSLKISLLKPVLRGVSMHNINSRLNMMNKNREISLCGLKMRAVQLSTDHSTSIEEVIEYIHFLQEKVHKYEGSFQGWNHEPEKLMPWRNNDKPAESFEACGTNSGSGPSPTLLFASKIDEKNITLSPPITGSSQKLEPGLNTATPFKNMDHPPGITNNTFPIPISSPPNFFPPRKSIGLGEMPHVTHRLPSDAGNGIYQPSVECQTVTATNEKLKEKELAIEGGAISISSVYSKGLLDTLTHALQSSGVDLSQASISVQIELRKQENIIRPTLPMSMCGIKGSFACKCKGCNHWRRIDGLWNSNSKSARNLDGYQ